MENTTGYSKDMVASWYSIASLKEEGTFKKSKGRCADGSMFSDDNLTCACNLYPLGTVLQVTNKKTKATVTVKITDRIAKRFSKKRIDLSKRAFDELSNHRLDYGLITVEIKMVGQ